MKLLRCVFVLAFLVPGLFSHAQTADEIVNKHINAIGGKAVLSKIKSQVISSELTVMGSTLDATSTILVGKGFKNIAIFNGQEIIQCVTPAGGWMINPLAGQTEPTALPNEQVKAVQSAYEIGGDLFEYTSKGSKVELAGRENIEGVNTHKLKLSKQDGRTTYYFIDPNTYYILKTESTSNINGTEVTATSSNSNFKKTDIGYVMPYTVVSNQGFEITTIISKVEFNKEIDPKIFEMPK